jgi:hypothetical protein
VSPEERATIETYLRLEDPHRKLVTDLVALLAAASADKRRR